MLTIRLQTQTHRTPESPVFAPPLPEHIQGLPRVKRGDIMPLKLS